MLCKILRLKSRKILFTALILVVSILFISQAKAQVPYGYGFLPFPPPFGLSSLSVPLLPPFLPSFAAPPLLRSAAIPLANLTPLTVVVPQVTTAAGLTVTSLVPTLQPAPTPTLTVLVNLTAGAVLPTTFLAPFPLTAPVTAFLPTVATIINIPAATPSLTTLIALGLGGGVPGLGGGTTLLSLLPLPVPTLTLPTVQIIPSGITPAVVPVI